MTVNPNGFICPYDGGVPRTITGKAIAGILPGYHVAWSGAADPVDSGLESFASEDILIHATCSGTQQGGVAIGSAASGGMVSVATRGVIISTSAGCTNSTIVSSNGAHAVIDLPNGSVSMAFGRAITSGTSGGYALVHIGGLL